MIVEALITFVLKILSGLIDPIIRAPEVMAQDGSAIAFTLIEPFYSLFTYVLVQVSIIMPFLIAWWFWRQVKS